MRCGAARRRAPIGAMTAAVGAAHRLPCAARPGVARRNSLRSLRELRSDNRRENDGRSALRAPTPGLRCSAPQESPRSARAVAPRRTASPRGSAGAGPLPPAALATSKVLGWRAGRLASPSTTVHANARTGSLASAQAQTPRTARAARRSRACAQPRSAAVPARARSALRSSDSPRLSERSSRSERSEFRGGAGTASIAGNRRAAAASAGTRSAGGLRRSGRLRLRRCERSGPRVCSRQSSARGNLEHLT